MILIDRPQPIAAPDYSHATDRMIGILRRNPGLVSLYQLGAFRNPGISDIDMLAVFADDAAYAGDPRKELDARGRYLFSHELYAIPESLCTGFNASAFYFEPHLLWGRDAVAAPQGSPAVDQMSGLKQQIALEFLLRMYINLVVEKTYRICKLRALLLQARALSLDLDLLNAGDCPLRELLATVCKWRDTWFTAPPRSAKISAWLHSFQEELPRFLAGALQSQPIYLDPAAGAKRGGHVAIERAARLGYVHRGIVFSWPGFLGRRYFNLLHRFNRFTIHVPFIDRDFPAAITKSRRFRAANRQWLADHAFHFMPLSTHLGLGEESTPGEAKP